MFFFKFISIDIQNKIIKSSKTKNYFTYTSEWNFTRNVNKLNSKQNFVIFKKFVKIWNYNIYKLKILTSYLRYLFINIKKLLTNIVSNIEDIYKHLQNFNLIKSMIWIRFPVKKLFTDRQKHTHTHNFRNFIHFNKF